MINQDAIAFLVDVVGIVEANSFEQHKLWEDYQKEWERDSQGGPLIRIGYFGAMPVCIALTKATVKGHIIAFVYATSQVVDYRMVDEWIATHLPKDARKTDAMNFHNVFPQKGVA